MALVSKRFARLCCSPELVRDVVLVLPRWQQQVGKLRALQHWLQTDGRGSYAQQLKLDMRGQQPPPSLPIVNIVHGCIHACSASLIRLVLGGAAAYACAAAAPWVAVSSLAVLELNGIMWMHHEMRLAGPLHVLTGLKSLKLEGSSVSFDPSLRLPVSLTSLNLWQWGGNVAAPMPSQVRVQARLFCCHEPGYHPVYMRCAEQVLQVATPPVFHWGTIHPTAPTTACPPPPAAQHTDVPARANTFLHSLHSFEPGRAFGAGRLFDFPFPE